MRIAEHHRINDNEAGWRGWQPSKCVISAFKSLNQPRSASSDLKQGVNMHFLKIMHPPLPVSPKEKGINGTQRIIQIKF